MEAKDINVWVIPSFYPSEDHPLRGIFFKEQTEFILEHVKKATLIYPESRSINELSFNKIKKFYFQTTSKLENGIHVYRKHSWNYFRLQFDYTIGQRIWINNVVKIATTLINSGNIPDIIHAHCAVSAGMAALEIKKKFGIPYIITEHSTGYATVECSIKLLTLIKSVFKNSSRTLAVSTPLKNLLINKFSLSDYEVQVVPNFIDTDYFIPSPSKNIDNKQGIFSYLTICQLAGKKRLDRLLNAFASIITTNPNVELFIGGTGPEESNLKNLASELKLDTKVIFLGELSRERVKESMQIANCFILPSDTETFGVVLIEAMSCGIPVISTMSGGPEDIIKSGTGLLVHKSVNALAEAMINIKSNIIDYSPITIRNEVECNFSSKVVSLKYCQIYSEEIKKFKQNKHQTDDTTL